MKGIFNFKGLSRPPAATPTPAPVPAPVTNTLAHTTHLQPKYTVPAVPHPRPHDHIAILATPDALLLRPHFHGSEQPHPYVHIAYGKHYKVEEREDNGEGHGVEWASAAVVYGIVGIIDLYTSTFICSSLVNVIECTGSFIPACNHFQGRYRPR